MAARRPRRLQSIGKALLMSMEEPLPPPLGGDSLDQRTDAKALLGGRLPLLKTAELNQTQEELYRYLSTTKISQISKAHLTGALPDGSLIGPFNFFLYNPKAGYALNAWMDAQGREPALPADVVQVVILAVGSAWKSSYELYAHTAAARGAGVNDGAIAQILAGAEPRGLSDPAMAAYRFASELANVKVVSDATYDRAVELFGIGGVVDMVHLFGYYVVTCALLNAFCVPAP